MYEIAWLILGPENISTKQRGWDRMPAKLVCKVDGTGPGRDGQKSQHLNLEVGTANNLWWRVGLSFRHVTHHGYERQVRKSRDGRVESLISRPLSSRRLPTFLSPFIPLSPSLPTSRHSLLSFLFLVSPSLSCLLFFLPTNPRDLLESLRSEALESSDGLIG